jgi:ATP-binding cassette, subfamily B, bacterial CvaB/MchF/RaxB
MVLDEGTSHLDVDAETRVNKSVAALGITRVIIAHRESTINSADRVVELIDGVIKMH